MSFSLYGDQVKRETEYYINVLRPRTLLNCKYIITFWCHWVVLQRIFPIMLIFLKEIFSSILERIKIHIHHNNIYAIVHLIRGEQDWFRQATNKLTTCLASQPDVSMTSRWTTALPLAGRYHGSGRSGGNSLLPRRPTTAISA